MGLFEHFVEGLGEGFALAASGALHNPGRRLIESCCSEIGWDIDERLADGDIVLYFKDPIVRRRKPLISCGDTGRVALFSVFSAASLAVRQVPPDLTGYLLNRNRETAIPSWQLSVEDGTVTFAACYCALAQGLDAKLFKYICEATVKEVHEFDAKLRVAGLL